MLKNISKTHQIKKESFIFHHFVHSTEGKQKKMRTYLQNDVGSCLRVSIFMYD